jgi:26S proteasome regulatory subunit (ATPase 3-interacting protein)
VCVAPSHAFPHLPSHLQIIHLTLEFQDSELRLLMTELSSYLLAQNRPFNNTNLVDSMAAKLKVGKTAVTKALDTLEAESLVQACWLMYLCRSKSIDLSQVKEFGKVKIYLAKQDTFDVPSTEELAEMDAQIMSLKEQLAAASEQHKLLQAELKGVESALSDEQLQLQLAELQKTSDTLEQKLASLKNPEPGAPPPISAEQMSTIEKSLAKFSTEWKKRKRICYDVLNKFSEQNGKKIKVIGEEIGIEFDEDFGAVLSPTPTVGAPSRGPPSAMAGRVYPPVMAAKANVPAKVTPSTAVKSAAVAPKPTSTASKTTPAAPLKPVTASKAVAKTAAPKSNVASKKKVQADSNSDSDSDSDSDSFSESGSSSPKAPKKKPAAASKAAPAAPKGKPAAKSTTAKSSAAKPVSKPAAKKVAKSKAKSDSDSESSFNTSDSESSDSDAIPMVKSVASKTPRAAAAQASAILSKKSKADSDSDFEQ